MSTNIFKWSIVASIVLALGIAFSSCSDDDNSIDGDGGQQSMQLPTTIQSQEGDIESKLSISYDEQNRIATIQKAFMGNESQSKYTFLYNAKNQLEKVEMAEGTDGGVGYQIVQIYEYNANVIRVVETYKSDGMGDIKFNYTLTLNDKQQLEKMDSYDAMQFFKFAYDAKGNLTETLEFEEEESDIVFKSIYEYDGTIKGIFANVNMPAWYYLYNRFSGLELFSSVNAVSKRTLYILDEDGLQESSAVSYSLQANASKMLTKMVGQDKKYGEQKHVIEYLERK